MDQGAFGNILGLLRAQSGVDFTLYKQTVLRWRIKRRMTALHFESAEDYESYLRTDPTEIRSLLNDVLVFVGGLFRVPAAFKWLKRGHGSEVADHHSEGTSESSNRENVTPPSKEDTQDSKREIIGTTNERGGEPKPIYRASNQATPEEERKKSELEESNSVFGLYKALVDSSDDAIIGMDREGIIRTWNKGAEKMYGYNENEIIGRPVTDLLPRELQSEEPAILNRVAAGERVDHYETVRACKDGRLIDISLTVSPIINAEGRIIGASKIARDITERKRWEAELKRAHEEEEKANRAKDEFLATLSHELRTPLNPVLLLSTESASDCELPPGVRANFDVIRRNIELEARLIDDLLDLTRVQAGKFKMDRKEVQIQGVLSDTIGIVRREMDQKHITLEKHLADSESRVSGDPIRLRQIFWNVLKNAIKFTPREGTITVESHVEGNQYVVRMSDTGIGMTRNDLATAFEAFKQGRHSQDPARFGGLGLGLTITKKFVELHSGSIEAHSEGPDRGSTFIIRFPLVERRQLSAALNLPPVQPHAGGGIWSRPAAAPTDHKANILLVEDHEPTRSTLAQILERRHHKVAVASCAGEAMALAEKGHFDVVISDIGLPDGNGYDLFKKIHDKSPDTKGIALSGYGMEQDLARSRNIGFQTHLIKPVRLKALEKALEETFTS